MTPADTESSALWLMLLLGAYHRINPEMGWLFAVALGMQDPRCGAVWRALLLPLGVGHALAAAPKPTCCWSTAIRWRTSRLSTILKPVSH
jgi:hypothetical protein